MAKTKELRKDDLISDYRLGYRSRQASIIGRREVLTGKAKFGIFGDGKELPQLAIARNFQKGDWRSGYYRDQTWMLALNTLTLEQFFAQLYAHTDPMFDPHSGGRNMNAHFAIPMIDKDGNWLDQTKQYNSASDIAPTAAQMPRAVGLAYASVLYRRLESLKGMDKFSNNGNEVTWATIGNASTAEGVFWEAVNAIGVLHAPAVISVYDDGYGISVPNRFQMVKENISSILSGFQRIPCPADKCDRGYDIYTVKGWDYDALLETYAEAAKNARDYHIPALVHVTELTQPLGHSTSGSHERYKSAERLDWEREYDCLLKFREQLVADNIASDEEITQWEAEDKKTVEAARKSAWEAFQAPIKTLRTETLSKLRAVAKDSKTQNKINEISDKLEQRQDPLYRDISAAGNEVLVLTKDERTPSREALAKSILDLNQGRVANYDKHFFSSSEHSPLKIEGVPATYDAEPKRLPGFEILNQAFDLMLEREPRLIGFGEDVGNLGDVNQGFRGLQEKYGSLRVSDTGIREATILGQGIGMAMRGLRPIAEIQYLDYLLYALQIMADDLANLRWRSYGVQQSPLIIRTRGHRLEGIFHSGSPMAGILNIVRGIHVLVPRNMTQAAGFYNTLLEGDDPALVVEVLNGYRLREAVPNNLGDFKVPLGVPEILREGKDLTLVSYGATLRHAVEAAEKLAEIGIEVEVIDVQSLLPFDRPGMIVESLKKTSKIIFVDEDVPGGTTAFMMQKVLEEQGGFDWLEMEPRTHTAAEHRPPFGSDGDYYTKPSTESIFNAVYEMMHENAPAKYPALF